MATVGDYVDSVLSHFPALGAQAIYACSERAAAEIIESGSDDIAKPLRERCDAMLAGWGISAEGSKTASDNVMSMLAGAVNVGTEPLVAMLTAALASVGYNKLIESAGDGPFVVLAER